jgi:hypothetical protein
MAQTLIYEYGARIDKDKAAEIGKEFRLARKLYELSSNLVYDTDPSW